MVKIDTNSLGFWSDRAGSWKDSGYEIAPAGAEAQQDHWEVLVVTGRAEKGPPGFDLSAYGTSTFFAQDSTGELKEVGTAPRVCSGMNYRDVGHGPWGPGKIARVLAWDRVLSAEEIQGLAF